MQSTNSIIPDRGFHKNEYLQRLTLIQEAMAQADMDIMLLTTEFDIRYYSGFMTQFWQSPTRPWFLVIPASGDPVAVIPAIGEACMSNTWITDIRTWSSPHPDDDGVTLLAETLIDLGDTPSSIGLAMGGESHLRMPLADFEKMRAKLGNLVWKDATPILNKQRRIKSESEINKIRHVCQLASASFARIPQMLSVGMTEVEVFRAFKMECLKLGVDDTAYLVGGTGPGGYGDIISPPSERILAEGDVLILDTGCIWDGYYCDFDRNFSIGTPSASVEDAYTRVWDATEAGLELCHPGVPCSEVFAAMNTVMSTNGDEGTVGRLGHGLGMQLTETPSFTPFESAVLKVGMVMTLEPGFTYAPGKMMVHEENIVIRETGPELLSTRASQTLPCIGD